MNEGRALGLVGAGAAAHGLARALDHRQPSRDLFVWSRRADAAFALRAQLPKLQVLDFDELRQVSTLILAVSDPALDEVAKRLAALGPAPRGGVVLHLAGAQGPEVLAPMAAAGWATGLLHPLLALGSQTRPEAWEGATCNLMGSPKALAVATQLVAELGAVALEIDESQRTRYHGAAALLSQGAVALTQVAQDEWRAAGVDSELARAGLASLLESVAANLRVLEPMDALTGPIARGDWDTVAAHRAAAGFEARMLEDVVLHLLKAMRND